MTQVNPKKSRSERAAALKLGKLDWQIWLDQLRSADVLMRIGVAATAAFLLTILVRGWEPPFPYRIGYVPPRAIPARVPFQVENDVQTDALRIQAAREVLCIYENRKEPLVQLRGAMKDALFSLRIQQPSEELSDIQRENLHAFGITPPNAEPLRDAGTIITNELAIECIQKTLATDAEISKYDSAIREIFDPMEELGLLQSLRHDSHKGNQRFIKVISVGDEGNRREVDVARVRIAEVLVTLKSSLEREFTNQFGEGTSRLLALMAHRYISNKIQETLSFREDLSNVARLNAVKEVKPAMISYETTYGTVVSMGKLLGAKEIRLLRAEHDAYLEQMGWGLRFQRLLAFLGLLTALCFLCGFFIYQSKDRSPISQTQSFLRLIGLCSATILAAVFASQDPFHVEIIPVTLCAITATIIYGKPTALMLMAAISLTIAFSTGVDLGEFILLSSAAAGAILLCGRIRNRTRLVYVGFGVACIVFATYLGLGILTGQSLEVISDNYASELGTQKTGFSSRLIYEALKQFAFVALCGPLMTGILPFMERFFDIQTDLTLLELSDMSHPLLRQLAQSAPGTYNHTISVASLAEPAAEAIGANGLLVRVGACFHDIGKIFKPNYFVENQMPGVNRHDTLQPELSTLVIIAHVKDGADLARQNRIPQRIIDFIEQHHGTTLVEYFFRQAQKENVGNEDNEEVSERMFRYPGPKPQSKEAAILMIADAVESASRALKEPTSSRIQHLVDEIAMKKLLDGQFDECDLTLKEIDLIKHSLVKNLNAVYHGRVKYPDQQSAG